MTHKFPYRWRLKDTIFTKDKGRVFSCFACGGGSTMGYKLAGFDVLGCNEIDSKMIEIYKANHNPRYAFLEPIQTFALRDDLPSELYCLDILDGSPPCSSFSIAGNREKDWGKKKKFREGQAEQVLDTLFFDFIELAKRLQPKVVIAENVKGLLLGNARKYVRRIYMELDLAGYYVQHWLLDASRMGVPQRRERVFFIALRKDLAKPVMNQVDLFSSNPKLVLDFNEPKITYSEFADEEGRSLTGHRRMLWDKRIESDRNFGDITQRVQGKRSNFNRVLIRKNEVLPTITAGSADLVDYEYPRLISNKAIITAQTFPLDYDFQGRNPSYICGMSVPPVMMAQIAYQVYEQWLSKI